MNNMTQSQINNLRTLFYESWGLDIHTFDGDCEAIVRFHGDKSKTQAEKLLSIIYNVGEQVEAEKKAKRKTKRQCK